MSNETKIGLLAVIVIALFFWGYNFLKGKNVLSTSKLLYVEYEQVDQLAVSAPVTINGFRVGVVSDMYLEPEEMKTVITVLNINRGIEIPKNATAWIQSQGVMSGNGISIEFENPCTGEDCAKTGDYLQGKAKGLLYSLVDPEEIPTYTDQLGKGLSKVVDSLLAKVGGGEDGPNSATVTDLKQTVSNIRQLTARLNSMMSKSSGNLEGMLGNFESISANLKNNNDKINELLANTSDLTKQLKEANLANTVGKANTTLESSTAAINKLKATLDGTDELIANLTKLSADIKNGNGSMGKIMQNDELYNNLNEASREMALLLQDVRLHPKRYTRILSKKEKPYVYPEGDPADAVKKN